MMMYESPNLVVIEEFRGDDHLYAPKIPWMTLVCCALITIGQTLMKT